MQRSLLSLFRSLRRPLLTPLRRSRLTMKLSPAPSLFQPELSPLLLLLLTLLRMTPTPLLALLLQSLWMLLLLRN
jgi:hypothetical protein